MVSFSHIRHTILLAVAELLTAVLVDILNYALTLEHLEDKFYREGLQNFTLSDFEAAGFDETFYNNIKETSLDESTHVSFLTSALTAAGATPVQECTYAFGVTDVRTFIVTASILEGVGVTAYLGAAADIMSKDYLTAAGSILTVESRHSAYIRAGLKQLPFPQPFDVPLTLNEVFSLAAPFIVECPRTIRHSQSRPSPLSLSAALIPSWLAARSNLALWVTNLHPRMAQARCTLLS